MRISYDSGSDASRVARSPASTRRPDTRPRSSPPAPTPTRSHRPRDVPPLEPGELLPLHARPLRPRRPRQLRHRRRRPRPHGPQPGPARRPPSPWRRPPQARRRRSHRRPGLAWWATADHRAPPSLRRAGAEVERLAQAARAIPAKLPLVEVRPDAVRLAPERKRIHDAIRMATYNAESALARMLAPHYARAEDEARSLLREAFRAPADLEVVGDELHVRLAPLSAPRRTRAIAGLCDELPATGTLYPGTTSPSSTRSRRTDDSAKTIALCQEVWNRCTVLPRWQGRGPTRLLGRCHRAGVLGMCGVAMSGVVGGWSCPPTSARFRALDDTAQLGIPRPDIAAVVVSPTVGWHGLRTQRVRGRTGSGPRGTAGGRRRRTTTPRGVADREDVLGHRGQYECVGPSVGDEHRHGQCGQHVAPVDLA